MAGAVKNEVLISGSIARLKLKEGVWTSIDVSDLDVVTKLKWIAVTGKWGRTYACSSLKRKTLYLHRIVKGISDPCVEVDHINTNSLDNVKLNLRVSDRSTNLANSVKYKNNTTGYKGVSMHKKSDRFRSTIHRNKKQIHLGYFETAEMAALAYDVAAVEIFGEFARTNEMEDSNAHA